VIEAPNDKGRAKVFIIRTEYGYAVSPSPVVVPRPGGTLDFENLSDVTATLSILGDDFTLEPNEKPKSVNLPDSTDRVIFYTVEMSSKLLARGNSAPIIIRDP
jgi:hypothetical protein